MKPIVLCILDGCGIRKESDGNAFLNANKPNFDYLMKNYPHSILEASGEAVGLPKGQMGTSEVGHLNIGAGRLIDQPLQKISKSINDKTIYKNEQILEVINHVKNNNSKMHMMGLLSDGGVHSTIDHLFGLMEVCKANKIEEIYLHLFLDGRDVPPKSALKYIEMLENKINELKIGKISTIGGRYYGMDRDNNFDRLKISYDTIIYGEGSICNDASKYIKLNYKHELTDEFIMPGIINKAPINDNDGLIVFNFRKDRLREMLTCITNPEAYEKDAAKYNLNLKKIENLKVVTMYPVVETVKSLHAFNDDDLKNILVDYFHKNKISQLRLAETEKFAHVTFFFDGGREVEYSDMKKILIPSPKVATYDLKPEMSVYEVTENFLKEVGNYDVTIMNFANGDMVGHTGNYEAAKKAVECMDECLGKVIKKIEELDGKMILIADHGNCDTMWDNNHEPVTSHTTYPVPCIVTDKKIKLNNGRLCDVAPTMLELMNLKKPKEMNGKSLIKKKSKSNLFIILSFVLMFSLLLTYFIRFIHYYNIEHSSSTNENTLVNKILDNNDIKSNNGLIVDGTNYIFKGNVDNNYVLYSNQLFRIVSINEDNSIKLVTDDITSSLVWGYNTNYDDSYVKKYLEEIYYKTLNNPDEYIIEKDWCVDSINKKYNICKDKLSLKIGLLTYNDYVKANSNKSYLNINKYWWTLNKYNDSKVWYVFNEGGINKNSNDDNIYYSYGIRPSINIKPEISYVSGNGTKEDPYIIGDNHEIKVGSYLKYSDYIWKVISIGDTIKLVMNECLKNGEECLTHNFSKSNNSFDTSKYYSLANYLNYSFYYNLDKTHLVKGIWYTGLYNSENNYNFNSIYDNQIEANVGILNVLENTKTNSYTLTPSDTELLYTLGNDGSLYTTDISEELEIYPAINIDLDVNIISGTGKIDDPFIIE